MGDWEEGRDWDFGDGVFGVVGDLFLMIYLYYFVIFIYYTDIND